MSGIFFLAVDLPGADNRAMHHQRSAVLLCWVCLPPLKYIAALFPYWSGFGAGVMVGKREGEKKTAHINNNNKLAPRVLRQLAYLRSFVSQRSQSTTNLPLKKLCPSNWVKLLGPLENIFYLTHTHTQSKKNNRAPTISTSLQQVRQTK